MRAFLEAGNRILAALGVFFGALAVGLIAVTYLAIVVATACIPIALVVILVMWLAGAFK